MRMSRSHARRWAALVTITAASIAAAAVACRPGPVPVARARPECPQHVFMMPVDSEGRPGGAVPKIVEMSGPITNIPEFNDCQRFVSRDGLRYDSMYAIFASQLLDTLGTGRGPAESGRPALAQAGATIYSYGGTYPELGIRPQFNCLYLRQVRAEEWTAYMLPVGDHDVECGKSWASAPPGATELKVNVTLAGEHDVKEFPPVARWDWDTTRMEQFIGIKCGAAWCEVSNGNPASALAGSLPDGPLPPIGAGADPGQRRVRLIKGWHDYQWLAVKGHAPGASYLPGETPLMPRRSYAAVIPDPDLEKREISHFRAGWVPVATVVLRDTSDVYRRKFGFEVGENHIFLKLDGREWTASIRPERGGEFERRVTRRDHSIDVDTAGIRIPGAARWRWSLDDESIWVRCDAGCCEIMGDSF
jgi:hypothetical protein